MQSVVAEGPTGTDDRPVSLRSVERSLSGRYAAYAEEVDRLVRAGLAVMARSGTTNPRVSEIVSEARLSNQAFYRHFRSKEELLLAISDGELRQLVGYLENQMAKEAGVRGKVRRWVEGILAQAADPAAAYATRPVVLNGGLLRQAFPAESAASEARVKEPLRSALAQADRNGELDARRLQLDRHADAAYRLAMGTMESWLTRSQAVTSGEIRHVVRFVLAGMGLEGGDGS